MRVFLRHSRAPKREIEIYDLDPGPVERFLGQQAGFRKPGYGVVITIKHHQSVG
jgi:hypothetical protein